MKTQNYKIFLRLFEGQKTKNTKKMYNPYMWHMLIQNPFIVCLVLLPAIYSILSHLYTENLKFITVYVKRSIGFERFFEKALTVDASFGFFSKFLPENLWDIRNAESPPTQILKYERYDSFRKEEKEEK